MTMADLKQSPGKLENSPFIKNLLFADKKKNLYFLISEADTKIGKQVFKDMGTNKNKVR